MSFICRLFCLCVYDVCVCVIQVCVYSLQRACERCSNTQGILLCVLCDCTHMQILRRRVVWMIREYINHIPAEIKYGVCTRCIKAFLNNRKDIYAHVAVVLADPDLVLRLVRVCVRWCLINLADGIGDIE